MWIVAVTLVGCINEDRRLYEVELSGEVSVAAGPGAGTVHLELHHAVSGAGELATPLGLVDATSVDAPGPTSWTTLVPLGEGEGLVLYGWLDVDGDGLLCGLDAAPEPAGVVELAGFPDHALEFSLVLDAACAGPSALYPP
ncbi:MAG: hypothetical protein JNL82_06840 [Myxococcales bacterium]|nr:hypothetical protein [Myxococcales bacterium]